MVGGSADPAFDAKFREFLMEPGTQEVIAADQAKELGIMRKIDEMEKLEELQGQREQLAVAMQDLDPEAQRLIYPILRLKMVQHILFSALKESRRSGTSFVQSVRSPSLLRMLEKVRDELNNDPENARRIEAEWFHNVKLGIDHQVKNTPKKERQVLPATQMLPIIQSGVQLRINGNRQYKQGNYTRALEMFMQGSVGFELYKATNAQDQKMLDEVHVQVRRNPNPNPNPNPKPYDTTLNLTLTLNLPLTLTLTLTLSLARCGVTRRLPRSRRATSPSASSRATRCYLLHTT